MKENLGMVQSQEKGIMNGVINIHIMVIFYAVKCTEMEYISGLMEVNMKENI